MTDRCHVVLPVMDGSGNLASFVTIIITDVTTGVAPLGVNFYVDPYSTDAVSFPLRYQPGIIDLWSDAPIRLDITVQTNLNALIIYEDIDLSPSAANMVSSPTPLNINGFDDPTLNSALVSVDAFNARFQVIAPTANHQHGGDSAGSVILTDEASTDFNPQQTWIGYNAGQNDAYNTTGSTAFGFQSLLQGQFSTIVGAGEALGDYTTVIATEGSSGLTKSTLIGADNMLVSDNLMTVIGSDNTGTNSNCTTILGANNTSSSNQSVFLGDAHTDVAGTAHILIGHGNALLPLPVSQVPVSSGYVIGNSTIAANNGTTDDWFGGGSWYMSGYNGESSSSQSGLIQNNVIANLMCQVEGSAIMGSQATTGTTTSNLSFYGGTPSARPLMSLYPTDTTSTPIPALQSLMTALNSLGLLRSIVDPSVTVDFTQATGTPLEYAQTGQALQWSTPTGTTGRQTTNPFVFSSGKIILANQTATQQYGLFSASSTDYSINCTINFAGTSGVLLRSVLALSSGVAPLNGYLIQKSGIYIITGGVVAGSPAFSFTSLLPATNANITVYTSGTSVYVKDNVNVVTYGPYTASLNTSRVKVGFMLSTTSSISAFSVTP